MNETFDSELLQSLREHAMRLPETTEGSSCVNRAFKAAGKKNFLFLGEKPDQLRVMLKLGPSLEQAGQQFADDPRVSIGKTGWVTMTCPPDDPPQAEVLRAWIDESFTLFAPKRLL